jgi:Cys-rich protein (TIGR01571 family)
MSSYPDGQPFDDAQKPSGPPQPQLPVVEVIVGQPVMMAAPAAPTVVYSDQPMTPAVYAASQQVVPWRTGVLRCSEDAPSCTEGLLCMYCQNSRQFNMTKYGANELEPMSCLIPLIADAICGVCVGSFFMTWHLRRVVRQRYAIEGSDCGDAATALLCLPCSVCQVHREMSVHNEWPAGFCVSRPFMLPPPSAPPQAQVM